MGLPVVRGTRGSESRATGFEACEMPPSRAGRAGVPAPRVPPSPEAGARKLRAPSDGEANPALASDHFLEVVSHRAPEKGEPPGYADGSAVPAEAVLAFPFCVSWFSGARPGRNSGSVQPEGRGEREPGVPRQPLLLSQGQNTEPRLSPAVASFCCFNLVCIFKII